MTTRYTARRKAAIVRDYLSGALPTLQACLDHNLAPEEFYAWVDGYRAAGEYGLRVNQRRCKT